MNYSFKTCIRVYRFLFQQFFNYRFQFRKNLNNTRTLDTISVKSLNQSKKKKKTNPCLDLDFQQHVTLGVSLSNSNFIKTIPSTFIFKLSIITHQLLILSPFLSLSFHPCHPRRDSPKLRNFYFLFRAFVPNLRVSAKFRGNEAENANDLETRANQFTSKDLARTNATRFLFFLFFFFFFS